jgi:RecA-family ATPase
MIPKQLREDGFRFINLKENKAPLKNWKEPKNQFTWKEYKEGNVGIITGYNNLRVIDLDVKHKNLDGTYSIDPELVRKADNFKDKFIKKFGDTLIISTPSDGWHIYIKSDFDLPNKAFCVFKSNVNGEFRSNSSYVATVPSIVNNDEYNILNKSNIITIPKLELVEFLKDYCNEEDLFGNRTDLTNSADDMSILCSLIKHNMTKEKIFQIMELMPKWKNSSQAYRDFTIKKAMNFLKIKTLFAEEEIKFKTYDVQNMIEEGIPEITYSVDPFLLTNGITMFVAPPSSMKSFLAQQLTIACCSGIPFLEKFEVKKQNVLYLDEENGIIGIANRIKLLLNGHNIKTTELNNRLTCVSYEAMRFDDENRMNELRRIIEEKKISLIIIDSIVRFIDGDENKSGDVKGIFDKLKSLCNDYNLSILVLHHGTKTNGGNPRGSGDFLAAPDNVFSIEKRETKLIIKSLKERFKKNQDDGHIIKIISSDERVKLMYDRPYIVSSDKKEEAVKIINQFISENDLNTFKTRDLINYLENNGVKKNSMYKAIEELVDLKKIELVMKGTYRIL